MSSYIEISNFSKSFKDNNVLKDVNISFEKGRIYGIKGHNGSGKTVLLKAIAGLLKPTTGEILIDGKFLSTEIEFPNNVGILIENPSFLDYLNGYENLKYLALIKKKISSEKIKDTIKLVGLEVDKKTVKNYSLGMKQKLGIAQAIMEEPELLLLDEPTNALDKEARDNVLNILQQMKNKGCCIIITSHLIEELESISDELYEINNNELVRGIQK